MRKFYFLFLAAFTCVLFYAPLSEAQGTAAEEQAKVPEDEDLDALKKDLDELPESQTPASDSTVAQQPSEQSSRPNQVLDVQTKGNQVVSTNTILGKIKTQKGEPLRQETVNDDIKRLYATGFFEDIKMEIEEAAEGYVLVVSVIEKPIVKEIRVEGATEIKEDKIRKELKVIEGQILDRKVIKEGIEAVRLLYSNKGFKFVDIDSEVDINEETKEATIVVRITEGDKYKIKDLRFEGVQAFKLKKLKKLMKTKPDNWFRSGVFKEENFDQDLERLRFYYQQEGYLDVKLQPDFDYDRQNKKMVIIIRVEEGQHYVTGNVKIEGNRLFPESEIWQQLEMLPGLTYSQYYLSQDIERIREYYNDQGYINARVVPDIQLNRDNGKVDVTYRLEEGDMFFVDKVLIRGNTKTRDIVIRRELRIRPGEKFDGEKIRKSKQRLENLGFFEEVTYDTQPAEEATNRRDLIFRVKEKRTGELSFGGGISSIDNLVGFAEISQRNFDIFNFPRFTGDGQSLSVRARVGSISQDYNISFVEPYLFNKPISFGTDLFNIRRDNRNVDFDEERTGASLTLSRLFKDLFRIGGGYTLEKVTLDEISDDAPRTVRNFAGENWLSRLRFLSSYDSRDNVFNPSKGSLASFNGDLVGSFLGGDQDYYILQSSYSKYWGFLKYHVIEFRTRVGVAKEFGDSIEVPVFDRFYAGGLGTVRGYNYRRVGPLESGDAVGGQSLGIVNLEYTFAVPKLDAFRGAAFVDAGFVNEDSYDFGISNMAVSVGPGVKIKTPIGPVALYYGLPIANRDSEDENGRFEFSLSRGF